MTVRRTRRGPGRPLGGQPVADRDALLDAAERAVATHGPGVTIETIATAAGVTKPIVYARVGGKNELVHALAERVIDRIQAAVGVAVEAVPPGRPALLAFVRAYLGVVAGHRNLYVYVTSGTDDTPDRMLYLAGRSAAPIAEQLASMRRAAGADEGAALPWAYALIGSLHMTALWWITDDRRPPDELAEQLTDLLWGGLGRPQPS